MSKTKNLTENPLFYIGIVFFVNILQSYFTELANDEAYYWVYSQNLAWGYFDHPPASALLIALGYWLMENELGVRLFIVVANVISIWCIWKTVSPQNNLLFFAMVFGCAIAHFGFVAAPDSALMLTVSIFILLLKYYLEEDKWQYTLALVVVVAAIGYSKYHGIIVLFFALLANLHLLKRQSFWVIVGGATILLLPHFYWQYIHDFPTFRFHLMDRSREPYRIGFIFEYLLGQLLVFGPFMGFVIFWAAFKCNAENRFERTMKWLFYGVFGFFLFNSLRGRVEANWTAMGMIPLFYLAYHFIKNNKKLVTWVYRLSLVTLVLIFAFRIILAFEVLPKRLVRISDEFHGWEQWAKDLKTLAGETPVITFNNYQRPSKYQFYADGNGHSVNTVMRSGNQYNLYREAEENLQGKTVLLLNVVAEDDPEGIWLGDQIEKVKFDTFLNFYYTDRVRIKIKDPVRKMAPEETATMEIDFYNPTNKDIEFIPNNGKQHELRYFIFQPNRNELIGSGQALPEFPLQILKAGEKRSFQVNFKAPAESGKYRYRFSIYNGIFGEQNCNFQKLTVK